MYTDYQKKEIKKMNRLLYLSWMGAIIVNLFYYNIIANSVNIETKFNIDIFKENTVMIYLILVIICLIISIRLSNKIFSDTNFIDSKLCKLLQSYNKNTDRIVTNSETRIRIDLTVLYTCYTTCLGLIHTASLFGLVTSQRMNTPYPFYIFVAISIIGTIFIKPKLKELIEIAS